MPIEFGGSSATSTGAYNPVGDALAAINSGMDAFKKFQEQKLIQQTIDQQNADAALLARYAQPVQRQVPQSPVSLNLSQIAAALKGGNDYAPVGVPPELGGNPAVQGAPAPVTIQQIARIADMGNAPQPAQDSMPFALQALDNMVKSDPASAAMYMNRHQADPTVKAYNDWQASGVKRATEREGLTSAQLKNAMEGMNNADAIAARIPGTPQYEARIAGFQKPVVDLSNATTEGKLKAGELQNQPIKFAEESAKNRVSTAVQNEALKKERLLNELGYPNILAKNMEANTRNLDASALEKETKKMEGRPLTKPILDKIETMGGRVATLRHLKDTWKPEYALGTVGGFGSDVDLALKSRFSSDSPAYLWWQEMMRLNAVDIHEMYAGNLTGGEIERSKQWNITTGTNPSNVKNFLQKRYELESIGARRHAYHLGAAGFNGKAASSILDDYLDNPIKLSGETPDSGLKVDGKPASANTAADYLKSIGVTVGK